VIKVPLTTRIKVIFTTTYHPESNPVERTNGEIGRILRTYWHSKHSSRVKWLNTAKFWLNNTTHDSTGYTPQKIMFGARHVLTTDKLLDFPEHHEELSKNHMSASKKSIRERQETNIKIR